MKLSVVGGGNLGSAIALGYREANPTAIIAVSQPLVDEIKYLEKFGITTTSSNSQGVDGADVVIIAVKPRILEPVLNDIKDCLRTKIVVSVVAGRSLSEIERLLGAGPTLFRAMPNIAIAQRQSITCIAHHNVTDEQRATVETLFKQLGEIVFVDERMMDACTVMAGSGIAFALRYIRAAMLAGIQLGFDQRTSLNIVNQAMIGATAMLNASGEHPEQLIDRVATPKGCTIAGLNRMENEGFSASVISGVQQSVEALEGMKQQG